MISAFTKDVSVISSSNPSLYADEITYFISSFFSVCFSIKKLGIKFILFLGLSLYIIIDENIEYISPQI